MSIELFPAGTMLRVNGNIYTIGPRLPVQVTNNSFVYHATKNGDPGKYVFKYVRPTNRNYAQLIQDEIAAHDALSDCHYIVTGFDCVQSPEKQGQLGTSCAALVGTETIGYFMRYFTRGDLLDFVKANTLPEPIVAEMAFPILRALRDMHARRWVHRDIKLENIFLTGDGDVPDSYLGDLGYAKLLPPGEKFEAVVGTKPYFAPELIEGKQYDEKVDMWAFGVTLFAMLTGEWPFHCTKKESDKFNREVLSGNWNVELLIACECSEAAGNLIGQLLAVNPTNRPSAEEAMNHVFFDRVRELGRSTKEMWSDLENAVRKGAWWE